ncbi:MAG: hypothetical protein AAFU79_09740 [Myxococcota bacterium]
MRSLIATFHVAGDVVRAAFKGRAMLLVLLSITAFFALLLSILDQQVVDATVTALELFEDKERLGEILGSRLSIVVHIAVLSFGIVTGSGAAPTLLSPGRVEAMLALPLSRATLIVGTYLGVLGLAGFAGATISAGIAGILWWKLGVVPLLPALGGATALIGFSAVYAVMLLASTFIRSAPLGVGLGFAFWVFSAAASGREMITAAIDNPLTARVVGAVMAPLPRLAHLAGSGVFWVEQPERLPDAGWAAVGTLAFAMAVLLLAIWSVSSRDH